MSTINVNTENKNNGELVPRFISYLHSNNFHATDRIHFLIKDDIPKGHYLERYRGNPDFFTTIPDERGELRSYLSLTPILSNAFGSEPFLHQLRGRVPKPGREWKGKEYADESEQTVEKISVDLVLDGQRSTGTQTNDIEAALQISRVSGGKRQLIGPSTLADLCLFQGKSESELAKARTRPNGACKIGRRQYSDVRKLLFQMLREAFQGKKDEHSLGCSNKLGNPDIKKLF